MRLIVPALAAFLGLAAPAAAEVPKVVATIKPIHALVASVMGELGTPGLIVRGGASPHTYSLRPSDASALGAADVVFWTGHGLELFLEDSLGTLAPQAAVVALSENPAITLLPVREGGAFEAHAHGDEVHEGHDHGDDHEGHDHGDHDHAHEHEAGDMHFWLDPANAAAMLANIADTLAAADPEHAATYAANAAAAAEELTALTARVEAVLAPVKAKPFVVFHDAYQYFERRFGLSVVGSITVTPDTMPGASRIAEIRARLIEANAACVFAEPQFEPAIVNTIVEGTPARTGVLDPEGASLAEGPGLYAELVEGLAQGLADCLAD